MDKKQKTAILAASAVCVVVIIAAIAGIRSRNRTEHTDTLDSKVILTEEQEMGQAQAESVGTESGDQSTGTGENGATETSQGDGQQPGQTSTEGSKGQSAVQNSAEQPVTGNVGSTTAELPEVSITSDENTANTGNTSSGATDSGSTKTDDTKSDDTKTDDSKSDTTKPSQTQPEPTKPDDSKSDDTKSDTAIELPFVPAN